MGSGSILIASTVARAWDPDPAVIIGCVVLAILYALVCRRDFSRAIWFVLGDLLMLLALISPLDVLSDDYLFSAHMLQHMILVLAVPPLLILGISREFAGSALDVRGLGAVERALRKPLIAWTLGMAALWIWHVPRLYDATLANGGLHIFEHLVFLVTATIFWWPILAPREESRMGPAAAFAYLGAAMLSTSVLGILITFAPVRVYTAYLHPNDSLGILDALRHSWAKHPVPPDTGWWYVFGSATVVAFMIQVVTGMALATSYISSTGQAYDALNFITYHAIFGNMLRGMHYFGASAMVLLVGIHMAQVFLMGCYKYPREFNWLTDWRGPALSHHRDGIHRPVAAMGSERGLVVVVAAEQAARVPVIGSSIAYFILAGKTLGGATLSRFFAFHVFFIPAIIFAFIGVHLYLVFHDGISEPPRPGAVVDPDTYHERYEKLLERHGVPFWPDAAWRDAVFCAMVVFAVVALAVFVGPPVLDNPPDPNLLAKDPSPDWCLLWYYAALALIPRGLTNPFIIIAPAFGFLVLILIPPHNRGERHPARRPLAVASVIVILNDPDAVGRG